MRSSSSITLILALLVAFAEAPFLHIHQHEATQRHPGAFLHIHLRSAHAVSSSPEFRGLDPDEDAEYQTWFSSTPTDPGTAAPVVLVESSSLPDPEHSGCALEAPMQIGHDPPLLCPKSPRGPPV